MGRKSDKPWEEIKTLYCAGNVSSTVLGKKYGLKPASIRKRACVEQWPSSKRVNKRKRELARTGDPARALAQVWQEREQSHRESLYLEGKKSLDRFFASSPIPADFAEAEKAERLISKAINPNQDRSDTSSTVNIALLTGGLSPIPSSPHIDV